MNDFEEIKHKNPFDDLYKPTEDTCPKCGRKLYYGPVGCPEDKPGCLVLHQGYRCTNCGKEFQKK